jgi:hypothetical protein
MMKRISTRIIDMTDFDEEIDSEKSTTSIDAR